METYVIIGIVVILVCIGLYLIWKGGEYLYEVYIEFCTSDPNPDEPDTITEAMVMGYITNLWYKFSKQYDKAFIFIEKWIKSKVKSCQQMADDAGVVPEPPRIKRGGNVKDSMAYVAEMKRRLNKEKDGWMPYGGTSDMWSSDMGADNSGVQNGIVREKNPYTGEWNTANADDVWDTKPFRYNRLTLTVDDLNKHLRIMSYKLRDLGWSEKRIEQMERIVTENFWKTGRLSTSDEMNPFSKT